MDKAKRTQIHMNPRLSVSLRAYSTTQALVRVWFSEVIEVDSVINEIRGRNNRATLLEVEKMCLFTLRFHAPASIATRNGNWSDSAK